VLTFLACAVENGWVSPVEFWKTSPKEFWAVYHRRFGSPEAPLTVSDVLELEKLYCGDHD